MGNINEKEKRCSARNQNEKRKQKRNEEKKMG